MNPSGIRIARIRTIPDAPVLRMAEVVLSLDVSLNVLYLDDGSVVIEGR